MHAEMWHDRLKEEARFRDAVEELWPYALGMLDEDLRPELAVRTGLVLPRDNLSLSHQRGTHTDVFAAMWEEMTEVRRSAPAGAQW